MNLTRLNSLPITFSKFLKLIDDNVINKTVAKEVFEAMLNDDIDPEKYVDEHELKMDNNTDDLKKIIEKLLLTTLRQLQVIRVEIRRRLEH